MRKNPLKLKINDFSDEKKLLFFLFFSNYKKNENDRSNLSFHSCIYLISLWRVINVIEKSLDLHVKYLIKKFFFRHKKKKMSIKRRAQCEILQNNKKIPTATGICFFLLSLGNFVVGLFYQSITIIFLLAMPLRVSKVIKNIATFENSRPSRSK